nr:MAG TPA: hypothetical protein [Caudoviricetes sp.]
MILDFSDKALASFDIALASWAISKVFSSLCLDCKKLSYSSMARFPNDVTKNP